MPFFRIGLQQLASSSFERQKIFFSKKIDLVILFFAYIGFFGLLIGSQFTFFQGLKKFIFVIGGFLSVAHLLTPLILFLSKLFTSQKRILRSLMFLIFSLFAVIVLFSLVFKVFDLDLKISILFTVGFFLLLFSAHHFSMQHYGVLQIISRRRFDLTKYSPATIDKIYCIILSFIFVPLAWIETGARLGDLNGLIDFKLRVLHQHGVAICAVAFLLKVLTDHYLRFNSSERLFYALIIAAQPLCFIFMEPIYAFMVYSIQHWLIEVSLSIVIQDRLQRREDVRTLFIVIGTNVVLAALFYYYCFREIAELKNLVNLKVYSFQHIDFEKYKFFDILLLSFGVWVISLHFYLSRLLYSDKDIKKLINLNSEKASN